MLHLGAPCALAVGQRALVFSPTPEPADVKASRTPIVVVVFDEFTGQTLLDARNRIDPVLFPNFARLVRDGGVYYRNYTAAGDETTRVIAALLTGDKRHEHTLPIVRRTRTTCSRSSAGRPARGHRGGERPLPAERLRGGRRARLAHEARERLARGRRARVSPSVAPSALEDRLISPRRSGGRRC
ncbi:MAG: hypothetical protein M3327_10305 [Actinomycetota bacterium]|nr:hypothetical protein [Actinomycetota bacterium]